MDRWEVVPPPRGRTPCAEERKSNNIDIDSVQNCSEKSSPTSLDADIGLLYNIPAPFVKDFP